MEGNDKYKNKREGGAERIYHRNMLWYIYRALAEEEFKYENGLTKKKTKWKEL